MTSHGQFLDIDALLTDSFVRHIEQHDTLPSTNDRALALASDASLKTPALVISREQTAGRGRGEHKWWSADGALTFSLILDTAAWKITQRDWPRLSLTTAVALCDAIAAELSPPDQNNAKGKSLGIKWPNDVLIDGHKVCGILIESRHGPPANKDQLVIGIGINVNNSWRDAEYEANSRGTALCDETGRMHDRQSILLSFLQSMECRVKQLASADPQLPRAWQSLSWLTGRHIEVQSDNNSLDGICLGIETDGTLLIENAFDTHSINSGSVRVR